MTFEQTETRSSGQGANSLSGCHVCQHVCQKMARGKQPPRPAGCVGCRCHRARVWMAFQTGGLQIAPSHEGSAASARDIASRVRCCSCGIVQNPES